MAFTFYIDGLKTDVPNGDTKLRTTLKRDAKLNGFLVTKDAEIEYFANNNLLPDEVSGYTLLYDKFYNTGFCSESTVQIYDNCNGSDYLLYTGVIKTTQIEIDEQKCSISFKIQDNSFYAYINNNLNIKVALTTDKTKNKLNIDALDLHDVDCFTCSNGNYGYNVKMYNVNEVFSFLVRAITDNKVGFASDYLDSLEPALYLTNGFALRKKNVAPDPVIQVSFNELFNEINYQKNLGFFIDVTDPENPFMRIENYDYLYSQANVYRFDDIKELLTKIKIDKLYSTIKVGSTTIIDGNAPELPFVEGTSYFGFKEETFYPLGQCAIENELNLVNNWIISSNVINWVLEGQSEDYDSDLFLIEVNDDLEAEAYDFFGQTTPPFFYNLGLNNVHKLQNYASKIYSNVVNFFGIGGYGFRASYVDDTVIASTNPSSPAYVPPNTSGGGLIVFADETSGENFDGSGNYNNVTGIYTCPVTGNYSFLANYIVEIQGVYSGNYVELIYGVIHRDSTDSVTKSSSFQTFNATINSTFTLGVSHSMVADASDLVYTTIAIRFLGTFNQPLYQAVFLQQDISFFTCNGTPEGAQTFTSNDTIKILEHEFQYHIPALDWMDILASPIGSIDFEKDGSTRTGWIEQMVHDDQTGQTTIKLITQNATTS